MKAIGCVYQITFTGLRTYVGSSKNYGARRKQHLNALRRGNHHSKPLQRAFEKYGEHKIRFQITLICSTSDLLFYEQLAIDGLKPRYNVNVTARGGHPITAETRAIISSSVLRNLTSEERSARARRARASWTEESRRKQRESLTGRKDSEETRQKKIAKLIGHPVSGETREKLALSAGWKHSEEAKAKMRGKRNLSEAARQDLSNRARGNRNRLGAIIPQEMRERISAKLSGRRRGPEAIAKHLATNAAKRAALNSVDGEYEER